MLLLLLQMLLMPLLLLAVPCNHQVHVCLARIAVAATAATC
jgi:hypothetical protein